MNNQRLIQLSDQVRKLGQEPTVILHQTLMELQATKLILPVKSCNNCTLQNGCESRSAAVKLAQSARDRMIRENHERFHGDVQHITASYCSDYDCIDDPIFKR